MRQALYDALTANCRVIRQWFQPYVPTASTPKPYGVIVMAERTQATRVGAFQDFTVYLYAEPGDYTILDAAVEEVKQVLHERRLLARNGRLFGVQWNMDGKDYYDDTLRAIARYVEFTIPGGVTDG